MTRQYSNVLHHGEAASLIAGNALKMGVAVCGYCPDTMRLAGRTLLGGNAGTACV